MISEKPMMALSGSAQLVAHIGQEFALGAVGVFGAGLLFRIFFRQLGELLGLMLQRLLGFAQVGDQCHQPLLIVHEAFLMALERGDVGTHRHVAAILGAALGDLQPAAVGELRLEGARAFFRLVFRLQRGAGDGVTTHRRDDLERRAAWMASSGSSCRDWNLELQSTSRFLLSHSTKASEMLSMASRRRMSAVTVRSAMCCVSVTSMAMPMR